MLVMVVGVLVVGESELVTVVFAVVGGCVGW